MSIIWVSLVAGMPCRIGHGARSLVHSQQLRAITSSDTFIGFGFRCHLRSFADLSEAARNAFAWLSSQHTIAQIITKVNSQARWRQQLLKQHERRQHSDIRPREI